MNVNKDCERPAVGPPCVCTWGGWVHWDCIVMAMMIQVFVKGPPWLRCLTGCLHCSGQRFDPWSGN